MEGLIFFDNFACLTEHRSHMIKLQTPVIDERCKSGISFASKIMMLGSCFSDNIGRQLKDFGFDVVLNPFGTLYNPISILNSIERMDKCTAFRPEDSIQIGAGDERWCSFSHHTSFARQTREEFLENADNMLREAVEGWNSCDTLIITLGTSWCFRHIEKEITVSNCLKRHPGEFCRYRLGAEDVKETLCSIVELSLASKTPKKIIFTVSPIRHFKDGAHGNQISKAALLLGIEDVIAKYPETCDYFPSFEIMMDELRDYRFYCEDMCHPSAQAVDYIRERFLTWALPQEEHVTLEENIRKFRHSCHRTV